MPQPAYQQSDTLEGRVRASQNAIADAAAGLGKRSITYTAARTLALEDMGALVIINMGTGNALTVPQDSDAAIPIGSECEVYQLGAGLVTVTAGTGATLRKAAATAKLLAQYARVTIRKIAANTWTVNGELAAS